MERRVNTRIGLIDVDGHNYPNLPLMKISAWHKKQGDSVEWYDPWIGLMDEYDKEYPQYGFASHKGYGTARHIEALKKYGPCPIHRMSFEPIKSMFEQNQPY